MMKEQEDTRRITVLNVVPDERFGGPQQRVLLVSIALKDAGIDSIIALPDGDKGFARMLSDAQIPAYQLKSFRKIRPTINPFSHLLWALYFLPGTFAIARLIRRHHVDVLHTGVSPMYLQGPLAARIAGIKLIWYLEGLGTPGWLKAVLAPFFALLPHKIEGASEAVGKYYFGTKAKRKVTVIYPPVDTSRFRPDTSQAEAYRQEFGIRPGNRVVGIVGNLNPFKGYEHFFSMARILKSELPETKFLIVGKRLDTHEKYWQQLRAIIKDLELEDDIVWAGHRTDIPQIMNMMDVVILASLLEAAPIVVLEAMSCARPIVATGVGGVPELIEDNKSGILVPAKDPQALAVAVKYLLTHPQEAEIMGETARKRAVSQFDINICAQKHEAVFRSVVS